MNTYKLVVKYTFIKVIKLPCGSYSNETLGPVPQTLVFDTPAKRLKLRFQKPRSKPKRLLKVFGRPMIVAIPAQCSIGQIGLTAAIRSFAAFVDLTSH
jgi:hypothetical protein